MIDKRNICELDQTGVDLPERVKLTTMISFDARQRFRELEMLLPEYGVPASMGKPGKIIDVLVLQDRIKVLNVLKDFFLRSGLSDTDK